MYIRVVPFPKPIRVDVDLWFVMRSDPVIPKAGIQRLRDKDGTERYLLIRWDIDPAKRVLMGVHESLEKANDLVLYDVQKSEQRLPPNIHLAHGTKP
jgi:hypothetical protein